MFSLANNANKPLPIKFPEKVAYGFGDFSSCLLYVAIQGFLMFYYTDYLHIDVAAVATIMFVSRIFDGFSDILMGHIIEKTKSKYGKARAWKRKQEPASESEFQPVPEQMELPFQ